MKTRIGCLVLLFLLLFVSLASAGSEKKIGSAGAPELIIPVGARGTALGGATVANAAGLDAIYWNPAGLASLEGTEVLASYQPYLADIKVSYFGMGTTIGGFGSLAATAKIISIGSMEQTTEAAPEGTGSTFNPSLAVIGLTYARVMTANVRFGATGMVIRENVLKVNATGLAFDAGVIYEPGWHGLALGLTIKNYGPNMHYSGPGFEITNQALGTRQVSPSPAGFELPSSINIGMAYDAYAAGKSSLALMGNFQANNFQQDHWQGGAEYSFNDMFFLRAGYNYSQQKSYIYGLSLGAGLSYKVGEAARLSIEYTWTQTDVFTDNQYFTFRAGF